MTSKRRRKRWKVLSVHCFKRWPQQLAALVEACPVVCQEGCPVVCREGCPVVCRGECQEACPVDLAARLVAQRLLLALIWTMMAPTSKKSINIFRISSVK